MPARLQLASHLSVDELQQRFRRCPDAVEKTHGQVIWLFSQGKRTEEGARITSYRPLWIRTLVGRYNRAGPEAMRDHRHENPGQAPLLDDAALQALRDALEHEAPPQGALWDGPRVAAWMRPRLGRPELSDARGWEALRRLGYTLQRPRPRHAGAEAEAQARFPGHAPRASGGQAGRTPGGRGRALGHGGAPRGFAAHSAPGVGSARTPTEGGRTSALRVGLGRLLCAPGKGASMGYSVGRPEVPRMGFSPSSCIRKRLSP